MGRKKTRPQEVIDKAVERHVKGEDVDSLAKEYGMSRAGFYLWVKKAKAAATAKARLDAIGVKGVTTEARISLKLENESLREDNERLRKALFDLMVKHKEI